MPTTDSISGRADVLAVLSTLARATADARIPVILRSRSTVQADALERWLLAVHGSRRTVIASRTLPALIEVRLPVRWMWPG